MSIKDDEREIRWQNFAFRLQGEASKVLSNNKQKGVVIVTAHILLDAHGTPLAWVVPEGKRIEPTKDALEIIRKLAEGL